MTPEQQRICIAEACGWRIDFDPSVPNGVCPYQLIDPIGHRTGYAFDVGTLWKYHSPDFLTDLNAIHEAEKTLTTDEYALFRHHLCDLHGNGFRVYSAISAHRAEAFLRAIGKWTEE